MENLPVKDGRHRGPVHRGPVHQGTSLNIPPSDAHRTEPDPRTEDEFYRNKDMTFLSTSKTLCPLSAALFSQIASESASRFGFGDRPQIFPLLHSRSRQGSASPPPEINERRPRPSRGFNFCDAAAQKQATSLINNPYKLGQKLFWFYFSGVNRRRG